MKRIVENVEGERLYLYWSKEFHVFYSLLFRLQQHDFFLYYGVGETRHSETRGNRNTYLGDPDLASISQFADLVDLVLEIGLQ